jgi:hypothetical protein
VDEPPQPITTAPRDGTMIWVLAGDTWVRAFWARQTQAWIGEDDPLRRTLHRVTAWSSSDLR